MDYAQQAAGKYRVWRIRQGSSARIPAGSAAIATRSAKETSSAGRHQAKRLPLPTPTQPSGPVLDSSCHPLPLPVEGSQFCPEFLTYAARAATNESYSSCDCAGSRTHRVYTPTAVPNGILNSEMKPSTSAMTRAQDSRCINPQPAMNPQAAFASTKIPSTLSSGRKNAVGASGAPNSC